MISNIGFSNTESIGSIPIESSEPIWNEEKKEISLNMSLASIDGKDYPNAKVVIAYYKGSDMNNLIETKTLHNLKMENGKLNINYTTKLPENPNSYSFEIQV